MCSGFCILLKIVLGCSLLYLCSLVGVGSSWCCCSVHLHCSTRTRAKTCSLHISQLDNKWCVRMNQFLLLGIHYLRLCTLIWILQQGWVNLGGMNWWLLLVWLTWSRMYCIMIIALFETMDLNTNGWKTENHILSRNSIVILGYQLKGWCHLMKGLNTISFLRWQIWSL